MQLNFRRVSEEELISGMERICRKRGIDVTRDALVTIASRADGSVRDALSILEQCIAGGDTRLDRGLVLEYTGAAGEDFFLALTDAVISGDIGKVLIYIDEIIRRGKDAKQILKDWLTHYRNLMVVKYVGRPERIIGSSTENTARLKKQADRLGMPDIEKAIRLISEYINIGRYSERPRILLETAAVRLAGTDTAVSSAVPGGSDVSGASTAYTARAPRAEAPAARVRDNAERREDAPAAESFADTAEPIERIMPAPRELPGSPQEMWNAISDAVSAGDKSFASFVGKHSRGTDFDAGELVVTVKPGKIRHANDKLGDITRAAKAMYGPDVFVTLRSGDPDETQARAGDASEQEADRIIQEDINLNDVVSDVENLFGIRPEIRD
jgi:DNA polymerase-3 subunit gamma/tau